MLPFSAPTPWPVIWGRALRSHQDIARQNALVAARTLAARRREREDAERYVAERAAQRDLARRRSS